MAHVKKYTAPIKNYVEIHMTQKVVMVLLSKKVTKQHVQFDSIKNSLKVQSIEGTHLSQCLFSVDGIVGHFCIFTSKFFFLSAYYDLY